MVLLVKPEAAGGGFSLDMALKTEPLELEYIMAMLTDYGMPSYIYEASFETKSFEEVLAEYHPEAVAVTGYMTQEKLMLSYARRARSFDPSMVTIIGGPHAQLNFAHFYFPEVSYICRSDNIFAIAELLLVCQTAPPDALRRLCEIDGLCYRECGQWMANPCHPFDLNRLPLPDRSQFLKNRQHYRYLDAAPVALLKTSSSCPCQCSFCYGRLLNCQTYFQRDIHAIVDEIKAIPCDTIQIADDNFLLDPRRLETFISLIRELGIKKSFICYGRSDFIAQHPKIMEELVSIGFSYFMVGLESVRDAMLDSYGKNNSVDNNLRTIALMKELGAKLVGLFIVDIQFDRNDFHALRRFIRAQEITYTAVSIFTPIPGTSLYEEYRSKLITDNPEKWDFMHLVVPPVRMSMFGFYLEYYLLIMDLFCIAQKAGIYRFLKLKDYKPVFRRLLIREGLWRR